MAAAHKYLFRSPLLRPFYNSSTTLSTVHSAPAPRFVSAATTTRFQKINSFHSTTATMVKIGDTVPDLDVLTEDTPANHVNLASELKGAGKGLIVGVPAAFSPSCSATHIPGYINSKNLKEAGKVYVVSVNDPFVMKAWGATLDPQGSSGLRFLGDPTGKFTSALDLSFDAAAIFGGPRSKRYALVVEDGKVKEVHVEPDNTGVDVSAAEKVLG